MLEFGRNKNNLQAEFANKVNKERDRRISEGFYYGQHKFDFDPGSKERITGAGALAIASIMLGSEEGDLYWAGSEPFVWVLEDNTYLPLDARDMLAVSKAAAAHESAHVFHGISLKTVADTTVDYTDDAFWPVVAPAEEPSNAS
jgi:hypothetical protein